MCFEPTSVGFHLERWISNSSEFWGNPCFPEKDLCHLSCRFSKLRPHRCQLSRAFPPRSRGFLPPSSVTGTSVCSRNEKQAVGPLHADSMPRPESIPQVVASPATACTRLPPQAGQEAPGAVPQPGVFRGVRPGPGHQCMLADREDMFHCAPLRSRANRMISIDKMNLFHQIHNRLLWLWRVLGPHKGSK